MSPTTEHPPDRYFVVLITGKEGPHKIRADVICEPNAGEIGGATTFKRSGEIVGKFKTDLIQGWWVEDKVFDASRYVVS